MPFPEPTDKGSGKALSPLVPRRSLHYLIISTKSRVACIALAATAAPSTLLLLLLHILMENTCPSKYHPISVRQRREVVFVMDYRQCECICSSNDISSCSLRAFSCQYSQYLPHIRYWTKSNQGIIFSHIIVEHKTHMSSTNQGFARCHKIRHSRSFSALGDDASCFGNVSCSSQQQFGSMAAAAAPSSSSARQHVVVEWLGYEPQQLVQSMVLVLFSKSCLVQRYFISKGASFSKRRQRLYKRPLQEQPYFFQLVALISCIHKCQQVSFVIVIAMPAWASKAELLLWGILFLLPVEPCPPKCYDYDYFATKFDRRWAATVGAFCNGFAYGSFFPSGCTQYPPSGVTIRTDSDSTSSLITFLQRSVSFSTYTDPKLYSAFLLESFPLHF